MSDEPLMDIEQLKSYIATVDAAEKAAMGDHFGALLALGAAINLDPPRTYAALLGWMVAGLQTMSEVNGLSIPDMAADLRARGAA